MPTNSSRPWWNWWSNGLGYRWFWNKPYSLRDPKTYHHRSILDDRHVKALGELLESGAPWLFNQWYEVLYTSHTVAQLKAEIHALVQRKEDTAKQVGRLEAALANQPRINPSPDQDFLGLDLPPAPDISPPQIGSWWEKLLTIGLSLMLFLGLVEMLGLDLDGLNWSTDWPKFVTAVAGAVCMNLAEYQGIYRIVAAARRFEPRHIYRQDERYPNPIPFWHRFTSGDPAIWISLVFILMETLFAFIGLISLFRPSQQEQFIFQLATFAAAGLAATINLTLAWGNALTQVQWEQTKEEQTLAHQQMVAERKQVYHQRLEARLQDENYLKRREQYWAKEEELDKEQRDIAQQLKEAQAALTEINWQLTRLESDLLDVKARALLDHERWELDVRKWIRQNPDKVENFTQLYPQWRQEIDQIVQDSIAQNGHHDSPKLSLLPQDQRPQLD
jgi:hypothetical protein